MDPTTSWFVEAAKQVPALSALVLLVIYLLKDRNAESIKTEQRIESILKENRELLKALTEDYDKTLKSNVETLTANNQVLGSLQTLLTLTIEKDLKDASRRRT